MSTLLKILLVATMVAVAALVILRPRKLKTIGQKARLVGYLYVLAVLIGAVMQLAGWRT
ncbi:MAG: hypothetical protein AB7F65_08105 [Dehalococcoidia bacterium]